MDPTHDVISLGAAPWRPLSAGEVRRLRRGAALIFLAALHKPTVRDADLIARVFVELFRRLAGTDSPPEWSVLQHRLEGSPHDWDRCSRLSRTLAREIARLDDNVANEVVGRVARLDPTAAAQLESAVSSRKKPKFKLFGIELG